MWFQIFPYLDIIAHFMTKYFFHKDLIVLIKLPEKLGFDYKCDAS